MDCGWPHYLFISFAQFLIVTPVPLSCPQASRNTKEQWLNYVAWYLLRSELHPTKKHPFNLSQIGLLRQFIDTFPPLAIHLLLRKCKYKHLEHCSSTVYLYFEKQCYIIPFFMHTYIQTTATATTKSREFKIMDTCKSLERFCSSNI